MRTWHQVIVGLLVAVGLLVVLSWWVRPEGGQEAAVPSGPMAVDRRPEWPSDTAAGGRQSLDALSGEAASFHLAYRRRALPAGCAPILRIGDGGAVSIPLPPPLPALPGPVSWPKLGVLLPERRLQDLTAAERASLVAIWSRFTAAGLLPADAVHLEAGLVARPGELDRLLRWLR